MAANGMKVIALEEGWKQLKNEAINKLLEQLDAAASGQNMEKPFDHKEFAKFYQTCYNMCTQRSPYNWSEQLYQRHGETFNSYLTETVLPAMKEKHDEHLLKELVQRWANHKIMNKWMKKFFLYLDRYYVRHHSLPTLQDAGLRHFKQLVFDQIKRDAVNALLREINKEREGEEISHDLMRQCVEVFEHMGMATLDTYIQDLERPLLTETKNYYTRKSQAWLETDSTPAYMKKAEQALANEAKRVTDYLISVTSPRLTSVCVNELLARHETQLLEKEGSGCRALLRDDKKDDLKRMYKLFSQLPGNEGLPPISEIVKLHIQAMGDAIVDKRESQVAAAGGKDSASDPTFVKALLDLHDKYTGVVKEQFDGNSLFQKALKEAFEVFVNKDVGKLSTAEMLSTFCDRHLKSGGEKLTEDQTEAILVKVEQLFKYLQDKDLFSEIYRNQLAKRLLNNRSTSDDAERSMISKLKLRCGAQFTGKMEGMVTDLNMGAEMKKKFKEYLKTGKVPEAKEAGDGGGGAGAGGAGGAGRKIDLGMDFSVDVLTTGFWPSYNAGNEATVPAAMAHAQEVFAKYYAEATTHRRLKWVLGLGTCQVRASFKSKTHTLTVTTLQAVCLSMFNEVGGGGALSYAEIKSGMNLDDNIVKRVLHSLACGKYRVLTKHSAAGGGDDDDAKGGGGGGGGGGKEKKKKKKKKKAISTTDSFSVNQGFKCRQVKVRIPMASLDVSHNPKRVEEDRSIAIEAAIVRIMKARKRLKHHSLIAEVLAQLHFFKPQPKTVKKRIEHLIEREYLERDPDDQTVYKYLA